MSRHGYCGVVAVSSAEDCRVAAVSLAISNSPDTVRNIANNVSDSSANDDNIAAESSETTYF